MTSWPLQSKKLHEYRKHIRSHFDPAWPTWRYSATDSTRNENNTPDVCLMKYVFWFARACTEWLARSAAPLTENSTAVLKSMSGWSLINIWLPFNEGTLFRGHLLLIHAYNQGCVSHAMWFVVLAHVVTWLRFIIISLSPDTSCITTTIDQKIYNILLAFPANQKFLSDS